jgi:O-antigen/teichoic acid export membrane protein
VSIFVTGNYQAFYYWMNRRRQFKLLAMSRVSQSTTAAVVNLGMGLPSPGPTGLISGTVLGQAVCTGILGRYLWRRNRIERYALSAGSMKEQAKRYVNFPKYSILADSINNAANQIPVVLLTSFFGSSVVGFFNLTQRVLAAPISLVATSIFDVFKQRASSDFAALGNCREIYVKTFKNLVLISILPFVLLFVVSPGLFAFFFGETWRISGEFARIMTVLFFLRFTASPLGYVLYIAGKQNLDLIWQIVLFILTTSSIILGYYFGKVEYSIAFFTISYSLMYILYLFMSYKFAKGT